LFDKASSIEFNIPHVERIIIRNYLADSNFCGFEERTSDSELPNRIAVVNAETGLIVFLLDCDIFPCQLYDHYLAISLTSMNSNTLIVVDILTNEYTSRTFDEEFCAGYMTHEHIVCRTKNIIVVWNYHNGTETIHSAINMPLAPIAMKYYDMWVVHTNGNIRFYDGTDGTLINNLILEHCNGAEVAKLSDGRLVVVAHRQKSSVISFKHEEVHREISLLVMHPGEPAKVCVWV
jgi:hypothetical protein